MSDYLMERFDTIEGVPPDAYGSCDRCGERNIWTAADIALLVALRRVFPSAGPHDRDAIVNALLEVGFDVRPAPRAYRMGG